jgi:hypothetical protein
MSNGSQKKVTQPSTNRRLFRAGKFGLMAAVFCAAASAALLASSIVVAEEELSPEGQWLAFTRPMAACYEWGDDSEELQLVAVWSALQAWAEGKDLPPHCVVIDAGTEFQLAPDQPVGTIKLREWCPRCSPFLVNYYLPPRKIAGDFLKPTQMPKAIRDYFGSKMPYL